VWLQDPGLLSDRARVAIANPRNAVFVSAVLMIEIAIKQAHGKLKIEEPLEAQLKACRFHELPLTIAHAAALRDLPVLHQDPFDRMLAAQALVEGLTLVTRDSLLRQYDIPAIAA
jgi:PIN domain nuclease of toxin-antitoxin system